MYILANLILKLSAAGVGCYIGSTLNFVGALAYVADIVCICVYFRPMWWLRVNMMLCLMPRSLSYWSADLLNDVKLCVILKVVLFAAHIKRGLRRHALFVCLSVCLSRSYILSKRINISSKFLHHQVAKPFQFFRIKRHGNTPTGLPLTGASNAGG